MSRPDAARERLRTGRPGVTVGGLLLASCSPGTDATTAPVTPQASAVDGLWWLSLGLGLAVYVAVVALLCVPLLRSRRRRGTGDDAQLPAAGHAPDASAAGGPSPASGGSDKDRAVLEAPPAAVVDEPLATAEPRHRMEAEADRRARSRLVWIGGIIGPVLVLAVLLLASSTVARSVAHVEREDAVVIDVVGHMYWWEVRYPELDIITANEIHVPVDRPVQLRLTTDDVIHSFWIPRLHGKVDMIPGTDNLLTFEATETGRFRGQCAEFCGTAHAQMVAFVEVLPADGFDDWVASQQAPAAEPAQRPATGQQLFLDRGCAACHTVQGTSAIGDVGPDLTHLASRDTIAAGILPNTRENLGRLIRDPQEVKPGIRMPATVLDDEELEAVLDYLESLS